MCVCVCVCKWVFFLISNNASLLSVYVNGTSFVLPVVLSSNHKIAACMGL